MAVPDPAAARRALLGIDAQRTHLLDHVMPRWVAPAIGVAFAAFFVLSDLGSGPVQRVVQIVFWLGYLGFFLGPWLRQRRADRAELRRELLPDTHRRPTAILGLVVAAVFLGGTLGADRLPWPHAQLAYGIVGGLVVAAGGAWVRHALLRELRVGPGEQ